MILFEPNLPHWKSIQNPDEKHVICDVICHLVISVCVCVSLSSQSSNLQLHQPPSTSVAAAASHLGVSARLPEKVGEK